MQHEAIHATVHPTDAPHVAERVEVGSVYKIENYYVDKNKDNYRIVPHVAKIMLARNTVFTQITENIPAIPYTSLNLNNYGAESM